MFFVVSLFFFGRGILYNNNVMILAVNGDGWMVGWWGWVRLFLAIDLSRVGCLGGSGQHTRSHGTVMPVAFTSRKQSTNQNQ